MKNPYADLKLLHMTGPPMKFDTERLRMCLPINAGRGLRQGQVTLCPDWWQVARWVIWIEPRLSLRDNQRLINRWLRGFYVWSQLTLISCFSVCYSETRALFEASYRVADFERCYANWFWHEIVRVDTNLELAKCDTSNVRRLSPVVFVWSNFVNSLNNFFQWHDE